MARKANIINDIEMFLAKTFPNITDRQQGSPAAMSRAAAAKKLAAKRKEVAKRNSAEGPKRSVAKPKPKAQGLIKTMQRATPKTKISSGAFKKTKEGVNYRGGMARTTIGGARVNSSARSQAAANRLSAANKKTAVKKKARQAPVRYGNR